MLIGTLVSLAVFGLRTCFRERLGGIIADVLGATNEMGRKYCPDEEGIETAS